VNVGFDVCCIIANVYQYKQEMALVTDSVKCSYSRHYYYLYNNISRSRKCHKTLWIT